MQGGGGVQQGEDSELVAADGSAADLCDPNLPPEERLCGPAAERADDLGIDQLDLLEQKRPARVDLVRLGVPVVRRAALDHVGDIDLAAGEPSRLQQLIQQLARRADERFALAVLVEPGRLADEHDRGLGISRAEHHLGAAQAG